MPSHTAPLVSNARLPMPNAAHIRHASLHRHPLGHLSSVRRGSLAFCWARGWVVIVVAVVHTTRRAKFATVHIGTKTNKCHCYCDNINFAPIPQPSPHYGAQFVLASRILQFRRSKAHRAFTLSVGKSAPSKSPLPSHLSNPFIRYLGHNPGHVSPAPAHAS